MPSPSSPDILVSIGGGAYTATTNLTDGSAGDVTTWEQASWSGPSSPSIAALYDFGEVVTPLTWRYVLKLTQTNSAFDADTDAYALQASADGVTWVGIDSGTATPEIATVDVDHNGSFGAVLYRYFRVTVLVTPGEGSQGYARISDFRITIDVPAEPCIDPEIPVPEFFCVPSIAFGGVIAVLIDGTA